jgi:uncharacterized protein with PIN domain
VTACLDSWAVLAWLDGQQPAQRHVDAAIKHRPVMSWINAIEVYYRIERTHGRKAANQTLADLREVIEVELPGVVRMIETARLKAIHPVALFDCFAISTAAAHNSPLLTGDPEILQLKDLPCRTTDLTKR